MIRVTIKLETPSAAEKGYAIRGGIREPEGLAYLQELEAEQEAVIRRIEEALGRPLRVIHRFVLTTNALSVLIEAAEAERIRTVEGVKDVAAEGRCQPHGRSGPGRKRPDGAMER